MVAAAIIHPDVREVIPLMPEAIVKQDGTAQNDAERHAAQRCMATLHQAPPHLQCIVTDDRFSSHAPHIEPLQDHGLHSILGGQAGDQAFLFSQGQAAAPAGGVTASARHDRPTGLVHRLRLVHDVPLHASPAALRVNFIE